MSLQYIIDGYNVVKHASFSPPKASRDPRGALLERIRSQGLCGSLKNRVTIVFDGFPGTGGAVPLRGTIETVFSGEKSADDVIKRMVEQSGNPRTVIVVSDDREIAFYVKAAGAHCLGVEEFIGAKKKRTLREETLSAPKSDLTYTQMARINSELKKLWLEP